MLRWLTRLLFGETLQTVWSAEAFCRDGHIVLHPWGFLERGGSIFTLPVISTTAESDNAEIGLAVRQALEASTVDVPYPTDAPPQLEPLMEALQVSSVEQLQTECLAVTIVRGLSESTLTPTRNGGHKGNERGYHPILTHRVTLPNDATDDVIGEALLATFERCE